VKLSGHATVLLVADVSVAAVYYRERLGSCVDSYEALPEHYAYARREECSIHFARFDGVKSRPNSEAVPPDMFDIYVYTDDVDALHAEMVERGAEIVHGVVEQGYGMREFRVQDPNGFGQRAASYGGPGSR
jgi:uncharacterized glyoxalase superfamily protein PhnB